MRKIVYRTAAMVLSAAMCISGFSVKAMAKEYDPDETDLLGEIEEYADIHETPGDGVVTIGEADEILKGDGEGDHNDNSEELSTSCDEPSKEEQISSNPLDVDDISEKNTKTDSDREETVKEETDNTGKQSDKDPEDVEMLNAEPTIADETKDTDISDSDVKAEDIDVEEADDFLRPTELITDVGEHTITAVGDMPDGAELNVEEITYMKTAEDAVNDAFADKIRFTAVHAFDIRILTGEEEWQPVDDDAIVQITISDLDIEEAGDEEEIRVYRIEDDSSGVTDMNASIDGDTVTFETEHFTVYTVGSADYDADEADISWDLSAEQDGSINAYWFEKDAQLLITGSGAMRNSFSVISDEFKDKPFNVEWVDAEGITSISDYLFDSCESMTMDSLPSGIRRIGDGAFSGCKNISITSLPEDCLEIGSYAFFECDNIQISEFPNMVERIGNNAFTSCKGLEVDLVLPSLKSLGSCVFSYSGIKSVDMSESTELTTIEYSCFGYCDLLETVVLPGSVESIESGAFAYNKALVSIEFYGDSSLEKIEEYAFAGCSSMESFSFPEGVKTIEYNAFSYSGLKEVDLSGCADLVEIKHDAFLQCPLNKIILSAEIESIEEAVFKETDILELDLSHCTSLTSIGNFAFANCNKLSKLTLPDSMTSLDEFGAFYGCNNLTEINGGNSLISVDISSFIASENGAFFNYDYETTPNDGRMDFSHSYFNLQRTDLNYTSAYVVTRIDTTSEALKAYDWEYACRRVTKIITVDGVDYDVTDADAYDLSYFQDKSIIAYYFVQDGVPYLLVSGKGEMKDYYCSNVYGNEVSPLADIREYTLIWDDQGIQTIGDCVFKNYTAYSSDSGSEPKSTITTLPSGLERIGMDAFTNTGISSELPDSVTYIGMSAFQDCPNLTIDHLPASLETMNEYVFAFCDGIKSMTIHEGIGDSTHGTGYIAAGAFMGCKNLETVVFPDDTEIIGDSAFISCKKLKNCDLSERTVSIERMAFAGCSELDLDKLPEGLVSIGEMSFSGDTSLSLSDIPESVEIIGKKAFNTSGIGISRLPENLTAIGNSAFISCAGISSMDVSSSKNLTELSENVFENCHNLSRVNLGDTISGVGDKAFYSCENLTEITAGGNASLGESVFGLDLSAANEGSAYSLPLKTVLNGDAGWFDSYDFKADNRLIGGYTVTLPMSVDLTFDDTDSLGSIDFDVSNKTNGWDVQVMDALSKELTSAEGKVLAVSLEQNNNTKLYGIGDTKGKVMIRTGDAPVKEGQYSGIVTFTTGIMVK